MEFNANRVDAANAVVTATITKEVIEANIEKVAKQAAKSMNIQGFRKGKIPLHVVKQRFGEKLTEDAEADAIRKVLADGLKSLEIKNEDLIGKIKRRSVIKNPILVSTAFIIRSNNNHVSMVSTL